MFKKSTIKVTLLTLMLCIAMIGTVNATDSVSKIDQPDTKFTYISKLEVGFGINSGTVEADASMYSNKGDSVLAEIFIQEYDNGWSNVAFQDATGKISAIAGDTFRARRGYSYRAIGKGYVIIDGVPVEGTTKYSHTETY